MSNPSTKQRVLFNTFIQFLGKTINTASSLIITFFIGRQLGEVFYGNFTKVFATATFLYMALDFGLNATVVKQITQKPKSTTSAFKNLLGLRLQISLILFVIILIFLILSPTTVNAGYNTAVKLSIAVFSLQYFTQSIFLSANSIFQKNLSYVKSVISASTGSLVQFILILFFIFNNASLLQISLSYLIGSVVVATLSLIQLRPLLKSILPTFNFSKQKTLLKKTAPIGIALVLNLFATKTDTIILTFIGSTQSVAFYGLPRRIFDVILVFPTFFMNAVYPVFLKKISAKNGKKHFKKIFKQSLLSLIFSSLVAVILLNVFAPLLVLIRPSFADSIKILKILSYSIPIFFVTALFLWTSISLNKNLVLIKAYGFALIVNITLNLLTIPKYQAQAPAVVAGISEFIVLLFLIGPVKTLLTKSSNE